FQYEPAEFSGVIADFSAAASRLAGRVEALADVSRQEITVDLMVSEAVKTMEIEGERLDRESVVNSIAALMGFVQGKGFSWDQKAEGIAQLMADVRQNWGQPLTHNLLFAWQEAVVPESPLFPAKRGAYRDEEMDVVSGAIGRFKVHYHAPPPDRVEAEMDRFIDWYNESRNELPVPIRAGIAHLWFETIHPFDDGNGRVGRAIADQALSQGLGFPTLGCLATAIEQNKKAYYRELGDAQKGDGHIQNWLGFFTRMALDAQQIALKQVDFILDKVRFFDRFGDQLNERQQKALDAVFRRGPDRVKRGITPKDYMKITKCPERTAHRDIAGLAAMGAIAKVTGTATRNVRYEIALASMRQALDRSGVSDQAQALFEASGAQGALYPANPAIRYDGPVIATNEQHSIQQVASRTFIAHPIQSLDDRPEVGRVVSIHHGRVTPPAPRDERGITL
uniref:Fic family protein n=2 Tax=Thiolapillus sp. TaxID=2017437 RepID=UPI0025FB859A